MSEFDAFASGAPTEEDPAAAFLAREQDQMAELEGEDFGGETPAQTGASEVEADVPAADSPLHDAEPSPAVDPMAMFETQPVDSDSNEMLDGFESVPTSDPYADFESGGQDGYAAISSVDKQRQEPEKIRLWREEQKERLATKDAEAEVRKGEWHEVAKRELEDWYKHREDQLEKSKKNNREAEAAFCQERDESLPGHEWERVTRLCEFNPKAARNTKDVSRMRSILLQLKQTPLVR